MKKQLLLKPLLALALVMACLCVYANEVTFSYNVFSGQGTSGSGSAISATIDGITISEAKGYGKPENNYTQCYAGGTMTITPTNGMEITRVVMTTSETSYNGYQSDGAVTASVGTVAKNTSNAKIIEWSGSTTSAFTIAHTKQMRITQWVVTYIGDVDLPELQSIYLTGEATKLTYTEGDSFSPEGLKVMGKYDTGDDVEITTGISWTFDPDPLAITTKSVSVTAKVDDFTAEAKTVTDIIVEKAPTEIKRVEDIVDGVYYIKGVRSSGAVEYLSFTGTGTGVSGTGVTDMKDATPVTFTKNGDGTFYITTSEGKYASPAGTNGKLIVNNTAVKCTLANSTNLYSSGEGVSILGSSGFYLQKNKTAANFGGYNNTMFDVTLIFIQAAKQIESISVKTNPTSTVYVLGETLNPEGLTITASFKDESEKDIAYTDATKSDFEFSGYDMNVAGSQTVTVTYKKQFTATFGITVNNITLSSIAITGSLNKTEYKVGDTFDFTGLIATGTYSDSNTKDLTDDVEWSIYPETLTEGMSSVNVTATLGGVSGTLSGVAITVARADDKVENWNTFFGTSYTGSISNVAANSLTLAGTTANGVKVTVNNGISTNGYIKDADFRMYNGYTMTVEAPEGYVLQRISADQSGKPIASIEAGNGILTIASNGSSMLWKGRTQTVTLAVSGTMGFSNLFIECVEYVAQSYDVVITGAQYATLCLPFNFIIPSGVTAYTAEATNECVKLNEITGVVPVYTGVVLYSKAADTYTCVESTETPATLGTNNLVGVMEATAVPEGSYILALDTDNTAKFFEIDPSNNTLAANKAYLTIPSGVTPSKALAIRRGDATGIENIKETKQAVYIDLMGRKVANPTPGIYILDGKKVLVK